MTHTYLPYAASLIFAVTLLGAGCNNRTEGTTEPPPSVPPVVAPTPRGTNTPTPSTPSTPTNPPSTISASSTLDTTGWQTYENKTLGYRFQYPLRGTFAPQFTVRTLPLTSVEFENDCVRPSGLPGETEERLTVNGAAFCRTTSVEGAAGSLSSREQWVTQKGSWYSIISFTKQHPNDPARPFDTAGYRQQVELILSTFSYPTE